MSELAIKNQTREGGWALLGLILALTVLGIVLVSSVTPNYRLSVQREKEAELLYRGQQMAEGIGKWYNNGFLGPPQLTAPPAYGFLKELKKLKEGVRLGVREIKFVRPSATIDPMSNEEWEPVYARDPRIMPILQAWAIETGGIIPPQLLAIAGPPGKTFRVTPSTPTTGTPAREGQQPVGQPQAGTPGQGTGGQQSPVIPGQGAGGQQPTGTPGQAPAGTSPNRNNQNPRDDDDDDDDKDEDPFAHLFQGSSSNLPIVGVAPKMKGPTVRGLYGLNNYEEWVFIYIPIRPVNIPQPNNPQGPNPPRRVSN